MFSNPMAFLAIIPLFYLLVSAAVLYFFFKIMNKIKKASLESNDILREIHEELKQQRRGQN